MLAGPNDVDPPGLTTFESAEELDDFLMEKSMDRWRRLFGQVVCRDLETGQFLARKPFENGFGTQQPSPSLPPTSVE